MRGHGQDLWVGDKVLEDGGSIDTDNTITGVTVAATCSEGRGDLEGGYRES